MPRIPAGAWVVIGDGEKALFLRNDGDEAFPNLTVIRELEQTNPPTREQGSERPGRQHESVGAHRSAYEETDFHRLGKERFAKDLAERLYKAAHRNEYEALVVAAPPQVLGEMRKAFHKEVETRLIFDVPKVLTNQPVHEIEKNITEA